MSSATSQVPPGWYPDPSGERQWRVWNGMGWSDVTRPYGPLVTLVPAKNDVISSLGQLDTLRRLTQFGVLTYYAGFALLVSLVTHWPGRAHPVPARFASATLGIAMGLTLIGAISFAASVRALRGRWSVDAVIPVVNTFATAWWISRRLGHRNPTGRLLTDALITVGFVLLCSQQPWVGIALAAVACNQLARTFVLIDQLSGPTTSPTAAVD